MRDAPIATYSDEAVLSDDLAMLQARGFDVQEFDGGDYQDDDGFFVELFRRLDLFEIVGLAETQHGGLDGLNDCIGDVRVPSEGGLAITIRRFGALPVDGVALAEILASGTYFHLLFGRLMPVLIYDEDPDTLAGVGMHVARQRHQPGSRVVAHFE